MEIKRNEATNNRPEGDRVIDASYVFTDIPVFVEQLQKEKAWDKNDRNGITVFKSGSITVVITVLKAGATIVENEIDGFMTVQVIKGKANFTTPDGDILIMEDQLVTLHPNVMHSVKAITDAVLLLTTVSKEDIL